MRFSYVTYAAALTLEPTYTDMKLEQLNFSRAELHLQKLLIPYHVSAHRRRLVPLLMLNVTRSQIHKEASFTCTSRRSRFLQENVRTGASIG